MSSARVGTSVARVRASIIAYSLAIGFARLPPPPVIVSAAAEIALCGALVIVSAVGGGAGAALRRGIISFIGL